MKSRLVLLLSLAVVCCLTGAVQGRKFVGSLRTDDGWCLAEKEGRVVLVAESDGKSPKVPGVESIWQISAPHMQTKAGKFLAIDDTQNGVRLSLSDKKTDSTRWTIDVSTSTSPQMPTDGYREYRRFLVGQSAKTFRLRRFDGPYENWYLAADPVRPEPVDKSKPTPTVREWQLTKDLRKAVVFEYIDSVFFVDHK